MLLRKGFILSFIFVVMAFTSASFADGDPTISLSPPNGTTFTSNGQYVTISFTVGNLTSCYFNDSWRPAEVWLNIDGGNRYYWSHPQQPLINYLTAYPAPPLSYSNTFYLAPGTHSINVFAKNFEVKYFIIAWLDVDEASTTNYISIVPPPVQFNLTVSSAGSQATVTVNGTTYSGSQTFSYPSGTVVNVDCQYSYWGGPTGNTLYKFSSWSDGVAVKSRTVTMTSNKYLSPNYYCAVGCVPIEP